MTKTWKKIENKNDKFRYKIAIAVTVIVFIRQVKCVNIVTLYLFYVTLKY